VIWAILQYVVVISSFCPVTCVAYVSSCVLWSVPAADATYLGLAATDHGEFITLVVGEGPSLLMAGNNEYDEVYDKKPQLYDEDNVTQW